MLVALMKLHQLSMYAAKKYRSQQYSILKKNRIMILSDGPIIESMSQSVPIVRISNFETHFKVC